MTGRVWTEEEIRALGVRCDLVTGGSVLGIGRTQSYDLARRGEFPVKVLRLGRRYVVVVASLLRLLELDDDADRRDLPAPDAPLRSVEVARAS